MTPRKNKTSECESGNYHHYCINGVKVQFPVKAYPTQISLMAKILQGVQKKQCALLESPTGSGKSLALLCATLAWLEDAKRKHSTFKPAEDVDGIGDTEKIICEDDGNAEPFNKRPKNEDKDNMRWKMESRKPLSPPESLKGVDERKKKSKLPRIYFGTRTHKQIGQIVRELKRTPYKDVRMCILGSREHTCIHPSVSKHSNKTDECKKLLKAVEGKTCKYYNNSHLFGKASFRDQHCLNTAWDIEDLVQIGKKKKVCPYFGTKELSKGAEIVFCPFNYLLDPVIKAQMQVHLKDEIVILDEAHNIEDVARDSASSMITVVELQDAKNELKNMVSAGIFVDAHNSLMELCDGLLGWVSSVQDELIQQGNMEGEAKIWSGSEMKEMFRKHNCLSDIRINVYKEQLTKLMNSEVQGLGDENLQLKTRTLGVLSSVVYVLEKICSDQSKHTDDYRVILTRASVMAYTHNENTSGWKRKGQRMEKIWTYQLKWCCLNPAVVFSEIGTQSRCVILTSGTLSPMTSFSSELGLLFPIQYEANHVITDSQVWVGTLSTGPGGSTLNANYKNSETSAFQDDVGNLLLGLCKTVNHGVLCFLPSYHMLQKLYKRWMSTGILSDMNLSKAVFCEASDKIDFDKVLKDYYAAVRSPKGDTNGALLLAVCRGKVSEGLDFSDDNARLVVTIGIPFPSVKDVTVSLKRHYNDRHCESRGLLSGPNWYELQAFRALNQALGRCLRHKNDWGALLLVDSRFSKTPKYLKGLSKWIRNKVQQYSDTKLCLTALEHFTKTRQNGGLSSDGQPGASLQNDVAVTPMLDISLKYCKKPLGYTPFRNIIPHPESCHDDQHPDSPKPSTKRRFSFRTPNPREPCISLETIPLPTPTANSFSELQNSKFQYPGVAALTRNVAKSKAPLPVIESVAVLNVVNSVSAVFKQKLKRSGPQINTEPSANLNNSLVQIDSFENSFLQNITASGSFVLEDNSPCVVPISSLQNQLECVKNEKKFEKKSDKENKGNCPEKASKALSVRRSKRCLKRNLRKSKAKNVSHWSPDFQHLAFEERTRTKVWACADCNTRIINKTDARISKNIFPTSEDTAVYLINSLCPPSCIQIKDLQTNVSNFPVNAYLSEDEITVPLFCRICWNKAQPSAIGFKQMSLTDPTLMKCYLLADKLLEQDEK